MLVTFLPICLVFVYDATGHKWRNKIHDDAPNLMSPTACYYASALLGAFSGYGATTHQNAEVWEVPLGICCGILGYTCALYTGSSYLLSVPRGTASGIVVTMVTVLGSLPGLALYGFVLMMIKDPYQRPRRRTELPNEETTSLVEMEIARSSA